MPDSFILEEPQDYILRTMAEIARLGDFLKEARKGSDLRRIEELNILKFRLVERILRLRAQKTFLKGQIEVKYLRHPQGKTSAELVEINFFPAKGQKFIDIRLLANHHLYSRKLCELIDASGGYDKEGRRLSNL